MDGLIPDETVQTRKEYSKPEILHEIELETRAGSPIGMSDPLNLVDWETK